jgi:hypothetical protein
MGPQQPSQDYRVPSIQPSNTMPEIPTIWTPDPTIH